jgi:hypothetical protein
MSSGTVGDVFERRALAGGVTALVSPSLLADGFLAAFVERSGGVSEGAFASLNLALASGDDVEAVRENRRRLCRALGIGGFAATRQVHGADVVRLPGRVGTGDALVTSERGVPAAVLVADCVPLALADPATGLLAVVHAGWRGVAAGVVAAALRQFPDRSEVRAAIGPAVGSDHYEVGEEVAGAVARAARGEAELERSRGVIRLDLAGTIERMLRQWGVGRIERDGSCTACEPDRFFSHRRDHRSGRQALVAVRL